jgi:hypothetical protein
MTSQTTQPRINLSNGTLINLKLVIDDIAAFNRYIIKEHGNTLQGEDVFGKLPTVNCVANCVYDELSGWLDNPNILGLTVLDIVFDQNKIEEENIELSTETTTATASTFDLIKLVGEIASKDHEIPSSPEGAELQLRNLQERARKLLQGLVQARGA